MNSATPAAQLERTPPSIRPTEYTRLAHFSPFVGLSLCLADHVVKPTGPTYLSLRRSGMHLLFEYHNVMTSSLYSDDHLADQLGCARAQHRRISIGDSWTTKLMHRRMATNLRCSTTGQSSDGRWEQCVKPDRRSYGNLLDPRTCRAGSLFLA